MVDPAKEVAFGAAAGCVGKLIEFPFDTVKVRLQLAPSRLSTLQVVGSTFRNEGLINGFYKGIRAPMVGACMENAVLFSAFQYGQEIVKKTTNWERNGLPAVCASGAFSGFAASFVLTPVELVKCKLQVLNLHTHSKTASYGSVVARIMQKEGLFGLWHGLGSTLLREMAGTAVWFATYEESLAALKKTYPAAENTNCLLSGAAAGFMFNLSIFPVDTVKLMIQTHDVTLPALEKLKISQAVATLMSRKGGITNFYNGLSITLIRSIPANAVIFYVYEYLKTNF
ncbi:hypothetical protein C7M61_004526 [Candidozyma pseudohaemuli]|uniref:Mitochondrial ornithine carrier protein n=1 Tax=Candidozyma pseudohaemuli TaxID=418784 RepID=A0A2P7YHQ0_9ASCO|nr:hypothetical protein C7M61_004526 [[Candida] pseudohaemulonii]PSK35489.1 hypothetical protein C7M61_004526 [[Candida] pseudohaemulonii]